MLGFGGLHRFCQTPRKDGRKERDRVKAEDRVFVLVTRQVAFAKLGPDPSGSRVFDIGTRDQRPAGGR